MMPCQFRFCGLLLPQRVGLPVLRQTHFVQGDSLLLGIMQKLLHADMPLGGGRYLFEQMAANEQERGEAGLRLEHGCRPRQAGGGFYPFAGFV